MLLDKLNSTRQTSPSQLAVVASDERLTYADLARQSDALACTLTDLGIVRGSLVAVYGKRTASAVVALYAIMKCGAAYTVVEDDGNATEHQGRLRAIGSDMIVCAEDRVGALRELGLRAFAPKKADSSAVDATALPPVSSRETAYVLYTSGSTGKPKGVAVTHDNIAHYVTSLTARLNLEPALHYAHVSTLAADLGNTSLFLALTTGGCLHLVDADIRRDPAALLRYLVQQRVDFLKITPSHWNAVFAALGSTDTDRLRLRYLLLGGEALPVSLARKIVASGTVERLVNHYGPTETTVGVTVFPVRSLEQLDDLSGESVPIGRPLGNTVLRVRADDGCHLARAVRGELYIGGPSVAVGYVNDPAATERSFVRLDDPECGDTRFYRTGDLVAIDDDGVVQFLGRVDRQVKVSGYRVELEHVESLLRSVAGVSEAAVFLLDVRGHSRLVAAIGVHSLTEGVASLRDRLTDLMPDYMIPKMFVDTGAFPQSANGKTDLKVLRERLVDVLSASPPATSSRPAERPADSALVEQIRAIWSHQLRTSDFGDDDDFFDLGGDSLDAIQVLAELQVKGHAVSARAFLNHRTVRGLVRAVESAASEAPLAAPALVECTRARSAAQDFFFRQRFPQPDHYNQAVFVEVAAELDIDLLARGLEEVVQHHPSLHIAHERDEVGPIARRVSVDRRRLVGLSYLSPELDEREREQRIAQLSQAVHASIAIAEGRLLCAHVFRTPGLPDQLLLVAHHLAVDVISWRILMGDIVRLYCERRAGVDSKLPTARATLWDWTEHLNACSQKLSDESSEWLATIDARRGANAAPADDRNVEGAAQTLWIGFSRDETRALESELVAASGAPLHVLLLAMFAFVHAQQGKLRTVDVDVESHGRAMLADDIDVSRVVGWHTSTYPLFIDVPNGEFAQTLASAVSAVRAVPLLGVAYGLAGQRGELRDPHWHPPICYNYLGEISFDYDERLKLRRSPYSPGRARGDRNPRVYELKLTGRIVEGQLVVDLSFPATSNVDQLASALRDVRSRLLGLVGRSPARADLVHESGSAAGLIGYAPRSILVDDATPRSQGYQSIVLTGATGYLGVHVLHELLNRSSAHIYCIARSKNGVSAKDRLAQSVNHYFPDVEFDAFASRLTLIEGDTTLARFGMSRAAYAELCGVADAIYHFAADTRLFGPQEDFRRSNVAPVKTCIEMCMAGRPKDLHYMSTLAVCGINRGERPVDFSEESADIGQEFQNYYESTKFEAENLVRRFDVPGRRSFIYRSGDVSGHSKTGRFQANARDNRLVQLLIACAKAGKVPAVFGEPNVLSPVDEVAAGIVMISLDHTLKGGVYHVDSPHEIPMDQVFDALRRNGVVLAHSEHASYAGLFGEQQHQHDADLALGRFWASRRPRNVRYNHDKTHRLLRQHGHSFTALDENWLTRFTQRLAQEGLFATVRQYRVNSESVDRC